MTVMCPAIALPDLLGTQQGTPSQAQIREILNLLPTYFSQAVIDVNQKTGAPGNTAVIAFGIKVMPFDQQKRLIDDIRSQIDPPGDANSPPPGVTASWLAPVYSMPFHRNRLSPGRRPATEKLLPSLVVVLALFIAV